MITIEKLNAFGANTTEGLERCCGNQAKTALEAGDLDSAFQSAHALKGVLGNLSLTPMYKKSVEITELLRSRTQTDYAPLLAELFEMKDELAALCR